jgi:hypothetical protein
MRSARRIICCAFAHWSVEVRQGPDVALLLTPEHGLRHTNWNWLRHNGVTDNGGT